MRHHVSSSLACGDRVAVFTGRDYTTVAVHGVVIQPLGDDSKAFVYLPHLDSYCLVDDRSLLRTGDHASFAEIVFDSLSSDQVSGTYRRFAGKNNTFEITRSDDQHLRFDLRSNIADDGIGKTHLEIRVPSNVELQAPGCINLMRQILGLDYVKSVDDQAEQDTLDYF